MRIGLSGGIACGKTTVAGLFEKEGFPIFDADAFCRKLYDDKNSVLIHEIYERWGDGVFDKEICDRRKIAKIVFYDEGERKWLNSVVHPLVLDEIRGRKTPEPQIFDIPLLFEAGWEKEFNLTIAVWSPHNLQMRRLIERGLASKDALTRIKTQMPAEEKLEKADIGIANTGDEDFLRTQCSIIIKKIRET
jgi:dephospho-CoA kinase